MPLAASQIQPIFEFLHQHHHWNEAFQQQEYRRSLLHCGAASQRLVHLLHSIAYTQSKPSLTHLGGFWRAMDAFEPQGLPSLLDFTMYLEGLRRPTRIRTDPWDRLFHALAAQPGWGHKTSALFLKAAIRIHRGDSSLHFLADSSTAQAPIVSDKIYLPVDAVITYIFTQVGLKKPSFWSINNFLHANYSAEQMLVWDDLWYWGFFTQHGSGDSRVSKWNKNKFWSQLAAPKAHEKEVEQLATAFIKMLGSLRA